MWTQLTRNPSIAYSETLPFHNSLAIYAMGVVNAHVRVRVCV